MSDGLDGAKLRIICGPTAAGKSAIAMMLAERFDAMIVSADSRQVYRRFDIGTAKPSLAERARILHRGIDLAEPEERYSAALWTELARDALAEAQQTGQTPVVVGGTGFYIRALTFPLFEAEPLDPVRRSALARLMGEWKTGELRRWCAEIDPRVAHSGRTQLLRALETAFLTGVRISTMRDLAPRRKAIPATYLVIDPAEGLPARIVQRIHAMLDAGWLEEVRDLDTRVAEDAVAWNATGYAVMREHARSRLSLEEAIDRVIIQTRQYAKRQRTWFRHQLPGKYVTTLDPRSANAGAEAIAWWKAAA
ncbi:MAG: tRNA (adenosine(37)-N6)-dimethylallyltransferase MiaA [Gemmatimonadaceae bacterium]|nr:tRNA (adenosine(37)-N6)-dimethylallyltransferase MiaA [Gemmatimonadaceae bacterium]MDQ3517053.1 tRNA (adenosine(37)-N6)-dimethylallyltransferase MiaA [Gemmatimonadota bacterium]